MEDGVTGTVHCCMGIVKTGPNLPVFTCLDSPGELGAVPLEAQTVIWLGHHALPEDTSLTSIPGTGSPHHAVINRADWEVLLSYASNFHFAKSLSCLFSLKLKREPF